MRKLVGSLVALALMPSTAAAGGDPEFLPLGLYGTAWSQWIGNNNDKLDFLIYQAGPARPLEKIDADLAFLNAAGIDTLVVIRLFEGPERTRPDPDDSSNNYLDRIFSVLRIGNLHNVRAYTLDEENIYWRGRARVLSSLYSRIKAEVADAPIYQWYSSARRPNVPGERWPDLPADGWLFDHYTMADPSYGEYARAMSARRQPLVSIVWASPDWNPGAGRRVRDAGWWEKEGWKTFYQQVRTNKALGIPTAFFMFEIVDSQRVIPLWQSEQKCSQRFLDEFLAKTISYLKTNAAPPGALPEERPEWLPAGCA